MPRPTRIAVIGDIHAHFEYLAMVLERVSAVGVDGVLLVGDLGSHQLSLASRRTPARDARYLASVEDVLRRVTAVATPCAYVPGNHDLPTLDLPGNVDGIVGDVAGLRVFGIGGAGPARFGFSYEWDEDQVRARPAPPCDVILSHTPPLDTDLDRLASGTAHVGSDAIRERALAHDGILVCGHIHESPGAVQLGRCLCINAGGLGEPFGRPQVAFVERTGSAWKAWHEDLRTGNVRHWVRE